MDKIDFVILWVDGNDPKWLSERKRYLPKVDNSTSTSKNRFRDWRLLQFWFRGVEKYASWVNKIYFVTYGHIPSWLNTNNSKIEVIKHEDFIPKEYLPTFNSNTIILNLHRIKNLSKNFVLFNDDMFIIDYVKPGDFFSKDIPRDFMSLNLVSPTGNRNDTFNHMKLNNINIINNYYSKNNIIKRNFFNLYSIKNGFNNNLKTLLLSPWSKITGFVDPHIPYSYTKKYFEYVWNNEYDVLNVTCMNKFRSSLDVTDWLVRYFQLCDGFFKPRSFKFGKYFEICNNNEMLCNHIKRQKSKLVCINDVIDVEDEEKITNEISSAFSYILKEKSSYEK